MSPPSDLTSYRACVGFQWLVSDALVILRPLQMGVVSKMLFGTPDFEDVVQDAQIKLTKKLRRADEWRVCAQAVAVTCAKDAMVEFRRRSERELRAVEWDEERHSGVQADDEGWLWDQMPCAASKAMALVAVTGASDQDADAWVALSVIGACGVSEFAERHGMRPNAVYQAIHRAKEKVRCHLSCALCLSDEDSLLLADAMRSRSHRRHVELAQALGCSVDEVERRKAALRTRVTEYLEGLEER